MDWLKGPQNSIKIATQVLGFDSWVNGLVHFQWGKTAQEQIQRETKGLVQTPYI